MYQHFLSLLFLLTVFGLVGFSVRSAGGAKTAGAFTVANRSLGGVAVSWAIIGTLVGGASTIGTVEMAYRWGFAAWYFTLGSGIGCLVFSAFLAKPLRAAEVTTVSEFMGQCFGPRFQMTASLFSALGTAVQIVAQFLACTAILIQALGCPTGVALLLSLAALLAMLLSGGMLGASWIGKAKFAFLCVIMGLCAAQALHRMGGAGGLLAFLRAEGAAIGLFSYGLGQGLVELGAVVVGVVSAPTYLQVLSSAQSVRTARQGALLSAVLIPPMGLLGILTGLSMRATHPDLAFAATALPLFLFDCFPAPLAVVFMAGIFFVVLGTGCGLALGVATNLSVDFTDKFRLLRIWGSHLFRTRLLGASVLAGSALVAAFAMDSMILDWSYLSMGFRGAAILPGLLLAVWSPRTTYSHGVAWLLASLPVVVLFAMVFTRR